MKDPEGHVVHSLAPALLYLVSEAHSIRTLVPSQEWNPAGHCAHDVRVVDEPPAVKELVLHVLQLVAPPPLYFVSLPHRTRVLLPSHVYPGGHVLHEVCVLESTPPPVNKPTPQVLQVVALPVLYILSSPHGLLLLRPSHLNPGWHAPHEVRVDEVPPAVKDPAPHVLQLAAPLALYTVSPPHGVCTLEPSHEDPALHALHDVRVFAVPPAVKEPAVHVLQLRAPAALYLVSLPHGVCTLEPSHEDPALHALHDARVFAVPPAVNEPAVHVLQPLALEVLNFVSTPHGVRALVPSHCS